MVTSNKMSWEFLRQFDYNNPPRICLGRSCEVMEKYEIHKAELSREQIDINTYIDRKYFMGNNKKFIIDNNIFPYYCEDNVKHYVMWINLNIGVDNSLGENYHQELRNYICKNLFNGDESEMTDNCIYFQNIPEQRSVKCIPHLQIFVRK